MTPTTDATLIDLLTGLSLKPFTGGPAGCDRGLNVPSGINSYGIINHCIYTARKSHTSAVHKRDSLLDFKMEQYIPSS